MTDELVIDVGTDPFVAASIENADDETIIVVIVNSDGSRVVSIRLHDFSDISRLIDELQKVLDEGLAYRKQQRRTE